MGLLKKELALYARDEKGELIPQEVQLQLAPKDEKDYPELKNTSIKITPLTRGEIQKIFSNIGKPQDVNLEIKDSDAEVISTHCFDPKITVEEAKFMKPVVSRSIVRTIMLESGVKFDDAAGTRKVDEDSDELGKNSSGSDEKTKKAS